MQQPLGTAQTEQWSWILQTVWGWIWAGLSWILDWQALVFRTVLSGDSFWEALGKFVLLFFPATVLVAGVWGTMVSLYTIPFRSGRGRFLAALLMSWWDAVRMAWFYWFGLARFLLVFVGWIWGLLRLGVGLLWRTLKNLVTSPSPCWIRARASQGCRGSRSSCCCSGAPLKPRSAASRCVRR